MKWNITQFVVIKFKIIIYKEKRATLELLRITIMRVSNAIVEDNSLLIYDNNNDS